MRLTFPLTLSTAQISTLIPRMSETHLLENLSILQRRFDSGEGDENEPIVLYVLTSIIVKELKRRGVDEETIAAANYPWKDLD